MEREFSAPLHHKMNPEVAKLVELGYSERQAYRKIENAKRAQEVKPKFDYDRETPKGEWV